MKKHSIDLNGTWSLTYAEGSHLVAPASLVSEELRGRKLLPARVPAPIHVVLQEAGWIEDPELGMNSLRARWVEEMFWIYRHAFEVPDEAVATPAWLVFDWLEFDATVWLNGQLLGTHANAHRPARFAVGNRLRTGSNSLVVQVSTGLHAAAERPAANWCAGEMALLTKRHWLRKAQYQCGWDWNPRLMNVGILGDVRLEWSALPRLDQVAVFAMPEPDLQRATIHVRCWVENTGTANVPAQLRMRVVETGQSHAVAVDLAPGISRPTIQCVLERPELWWPAGHGAQHLYTIETELTINGEIQRQCCRTGVRRVEMDQSPHPVTGRYCILRVNNRPIFAKGGNWAPSDFLLGRTTPERFRELVQLARAANFNLLRVWGGATYAHPALCEACDEAGIMLWHDLLFACAKYPGDDPDFVREIRLEIAHALRQRAHHPSLILWCGNNEIEWGDWSWGHDRSHPTHPHYALFHLEIPRLLRAEAPATIHWISSPWSPDGLEPNDPTAGDQHPWGVSIGQPGGADWWLYRNYVDRLANEGGVLGASTPAALRAFLPEKERHLLSPSWDHHDNSFACTPWAPGKPGRAYHTVELWTGRDPLAMDLEEYAFVSGLLQAEGLTEYIRNYRRRMFSSAAAVFWQYNESWPATHCWSIVDFHLRRKLAFHPVRRAFAPVTVVIAETDGKFIVFGINDTLQPWTGELRCGFFRLAGGLADDRTCPVQLEANAATPLTELARDTWKALDWKRSGAFALLRQDSRPVAQDRLFLERFRDLELAPQPAIQIEKQSAALVFTSPVFAWGVCLDINGDLPVTDNCFDLIPGIPYRVPWNGTPAQPEISRCGNRILVPPK